MFIYCLNVITNTTISKNQFQFLNYVNMTVLSIHNIVFFRYNVRVKTTLTWIIQYYNNVISTSINFIVGEVTRPL